MLKCPLWIAIFQRWYQNEFVFIWKVAEAKLNALSGENLKKKGKWGDRKSLGDGNKDALESPEI